MMDDELRSMLKNQKRARQAKFINEVIIFIRKRCTFSIKNTSLEPETNFPLHYVKMDGDFMRKGCSLDTNSSSGHTSPVKKALVF